RYHQGCLVRRKSKRPHPILRMNDRHSNFNMLQSFIYGIISRVSAPLDADGISEKDSVCSSKFRAFQITARISRSQASICVSLLLMWAGSFLTATSQPV